MVLRVFVRFRAKLGDKNKKNKGQRFVANGCPTNFTLLITGKKPICLRKIQISLITWLILVSCTLSENC